MKQLFLLLIAGFLWLPPCYADPSGNMAVVTAMVDAINKRDLDTLDDLVANDVVRISAATAGVDVRSLGDFKAFLQMDFSNVPDSVMKIDLMFGNEEFVGMRAIYSGTQTKPMGPFPPSGKYFELPVIGILKFKDGRVSEIWIEWDNVHLLNQLGYFEQSQD